MKRLFLTFIFILSGASAGWTSTIDYPPAGRFTIAQADGLVLSSDPDQAAGPFGQIDATIESFGFGCRDGRYCGLGGLSLSTRNGEPFFRYSFETGYLPSDLANTVTGIEYAPDIIKVSVALDEMQRLVLPFDLFEDPGPDSAAFYRNLLREVSDLTIVFANLDDFQSRSDGSSTARIVANYVSAVPAPAAIWLLMPALALLLTRKRRRAPVSSRS